MQAEWVTGFDGPPEVPRLVGVLCEAAVRIGVPDPEWEFRRAEVVADGITYKFDRSDPRDRALEMASESAERTYLVATVFPSDSRDPLAVLHVDFDGQRTRLSVESAAVHFVTHFRDLLR